MNNTMKNRHEYTVRSIEDLGELLTRRRKQLHLGLEAAAQRLGVSTRLLFELEHGRRGVSIATVLQILQLYGIDTVLRARQPGVNLGEEGNR